MKFREAFVHRSIMKREEHEALEQKDLPVLKHVREFNRLSRYISEEVVMEAKRQKRFMKGLQAVLKMQLRIVRAKEFQELVDSTGKLKDDGNVVLDVKGKKIQEKLPQAPTPQPISNLNFPSHQQSEVSASEEARKAVRSSIICNNCGIKGHIGSECRKNQVICHQCGEPGHIRPLCPNRLTICKPLAENTEPPSQGGKQKKTCRAYQKVCFECGQSGHIRVSCPIFQSEGVNDPFVEVSIPRVDNGEGTSSGNPSGKSLGKRKYEDMNLIDNNTINVEGGKLISHQMS